MPNRILTWHEKKNKKLIKNLRKKLSSNCVSSFITIWLGPEWADNLTRNDAGALSVKNGNRKRKIIAYADVLEVRKIKVLDLNTPSLRSYVKNNIGSKNPLQIIRDMSIIHERKILTDEYISIVELLPKARKV